MKRITAVALSVALMLSFSAVAAFAQTKATVAIIRADWCSACQKVEPIMMGLMKEYDGKINFVMFDVTNDETTAQAAAKAKSLGLSSFFEANKKMTSTVAVFKGKKQTFKTSMNYNRDEYVAAFDGALK
ncbi:MAG: thioredoxin domain-containing protein [Pyrinomonadaceae bacterium]